MTGFLRLESGNPVSAGFSWFDPGIMETASILPDAGLKRTHE
jgi:hypothetical protein